MRNLKGYLRNLIGVFGYLKGNGNYNIQNVNIYIVYKSNILLTNRNNNLLVKNFEGEKMKLDENKIKKLVNQYDDCTIVELYVNHEVMGNWCFIIGNLNEETINGQDCLVGNVLDLIDEFKKYDNVEIKNETMSVWKNGDGYEEYVSVEWS